MAGVNHSSLSHTQCALKIRNIFIFPHQYTGMPQNVHIQGISTRGILPENLLRCELYVMDILMNYPHFPSYPGGVFPLCGQSGFVRNKPVWREILLNFQFGWNSFRGLIVMILFSFCTWTTLINKWQFVLCECLKPIIFWSDMWICHGLRK